MLTVEQTRDSLHPSLHAPFEAAVDAVIADVSRPPVWIGPLWLAIAERRRAMTDAIWDMPLDELLDLADSETAEMIADMIR